MSDADRYYSILELQPGDSLEEVNQAYRDLAFVWHPDRYCHNPRLQQKAHEKLKALNEAHEHLQLYQHNFQASAPPSEPEPVPPPRSQSSQSNTKDRTRRPDTDRARQPQPTDPVEHYKKAIRLNYYDVYMWLD